MFTHTLHSMHCIIISLGACLHGTDVATLLMQAHCHFTFTLHLTKTTPCLNPQAHVHIIPECMLIL